MIRLPDHRGRHRRGRHPQSRWARLHRHRTCSRGLVSGLPARTLGRVRAHPCRRPAVCPERTDGAPAAEGHTDNPRTIRSRRDGSPSDIECRAKLHPTPAGGRCRCRCRSRVTGLLVLNVLSTDAARDTERWWWRSRLLGRKPIEARRFIKGVSAAVITRRVLQPDVIGNGCTDIQVRAPARAARHGEAFCLDSPCTCRKQ